MLNNYAIHNNPLYIITSHNAIVLQLADVYALDAMTFYNALYQRQMLNRKFVQTFLLAMNGNQNPNNNSTVSYSRSRIIVIKDNLSNII